MSQGWHELVQRPAYGHLKLLTSPPSKAEDGSEAVGGGRPPTALSILGPPRLRPLPPHPGLQDTRDLPSKAGDGDEWPRRRAPSAQFLTASQYDCPWQQHYKPGTNATGKKSNSPQSSEPTRGQPWPQVPHRINAVGHRVPEGRGSGGASTSEAPLWGLPKGGAPSLKGAQVSPEAERASLLHSPKSSNKDSRGLGSTPPRHLASCLSSERVSGRLAFPASSSEPSLVVGSYENRWLLQVSVFSSIKWG